MLKSGEKNANSGEKTLSFYFYNPSNTMNNSFFNAIEHAARSANPEIIGYLQIFRESGENNVNCNEKPSQINTFLILKTY